MFFLFAHGGREGEVIHGDGGVIAVVVVIVLLCCYSMCCLSVSGVAAFVG